MKKQLGILLCVGVIILLTGCEQAELTANKASQESKKAKGYVETLAKVNKESKEDIARAVEKENKKLSDALDKTLEEKTTQDTEKNITQDDNNSQQSNMNDIPKEINMELAQTCKGATIKTNKGNITLKFYGEKAPITVANFCTLAKKGFYDNLTFHRIVKDFMIQGGDPTGTGSGGSGYKFKDELPAKGEYKLGSIAMANSGPDTNGSQFFIVSGNDGVALPPLYSLFGEVTEGMDTIEKIQNVETTMSEMGEKSKPVEDIIIDSIELEIN